MRYKPNYCCNCGEKVERLSWTFLTSRMFCENCDTVFKREEWMPSAVLSVVAIIAGLFTLGSFLKSSESNLPVTKKQNTTIVSKTPQVTQNPEVASNNSNTYSTIQARSLFNISQTQQKFPASQSSSDASARNSAETGITKSLPEKTIQEKISYCGAQTKKGTPCTRKVKGGGRCWQHTGLPAMTGR